MRWVASLAKTEQLMGETSQLVAETLSLPGSRLDTQYRLSISELSLRA